jgi:heterodisulfide reductase subunit D
LALREELYERNAKLPEPLERLDENIRRHHNMFGHEKHSESIESLGLPSQGEDVFFIGCYTSYLLPKSAKATVEILRAGGIDIAHLGEAERCCGEIPKQEGNKKLFAEMATHNVEAMKRAGAKRVIVSCAHGYRTWKMDYPAVVEDLPFEVVHVSELFAELLDEGKIEFNNEIRKSVTYHDPCFLRHCNVYDPPRKVLNSISGLELIEMERYGKWSYCCGAGAKISLNCYPDFAAAIGKERILEAKEAADHVVTACPVCFNQLRNTAKRENVEIEVYELPVLVAEAMGIEL